MTKKDKFPMREMMGAQAAGLSLTDFLKLDAMECDLWMEYALTGPTEARTQMLIGQLIQSVHGALGGKAPSMDTLIPWFRILQGKDETDIRQSKLEGQRAITNILLDNALRDMKEKPDGT